VFQLSLFGTGCSSVRTCPPGPLWNTKFCPRNVALFNPVRHISGFSSSEIHRAYRSLDRMLAHGLHGHVLGLSFFSRGGSFDRETWASATFRRSPCSSVRTPPTALGPPDQRNLFRKLDSFPEYFPGFGWTEGGLGSSDRGTRGLAKSVTCPSSSVKTTCTGGGRGYGLLTEKVRVPLFCKTTRPSTVSDDENPEI
jgi:hypothetical protein